MTEIATTPTPLTRREAREIERRSGHRSSTDAIAPVDLSLAAGSGAPGSGVAPRL